MSQKKVTHKKAAPSVTLPPDQWMVEQREEAESNGAAEPTDEALKDKWAHELSNGERYTVRKSLVDRGFKVPDRIADAEAWWIQKEQQKTRPKDQPIPTEEQLQHKWKKEMDEKQRSQAVEARKKHEDRLEAAKEKEKTPGAKLGNSTKSMLASPTGYAPRHLPMHNARGELLNGAQAACQRRADATLALQSAAGMCSCEGCVLGPGGDPLFANLVEFAHRLGEEKRGGVTMLPVAQQSDEAAKCERKCAACHLKEDSIPQLQFRKFDQLKGNLRKLAKLKMETGCQHPEHANMPYAAAVDSIPKEYRHTFLHRSCIKRGTTNRPSDHMKMTRQQRAAFRLAELKAGTAVVHCKFCHIEWTVCEHAKLSATGVSIALFQRLKAAYPAFVAEFELKTSTFDWKAQAKKDAAALSAGKKAASAKKRAAAAEEQKEAEPEDDDDFDPLDKTEPAPGLNEGDKDSFGLFKDDDDAEDEEEEEAAAASAATWADEPSSPTTEEDVVYARVLLKFINTKRGLYRQQKKQTKQEEEMRDE